MTKLTVVGPWARGYLIIAYALALMTFMTAGGSAGAGRFFTIACFLWTLPFSLLILLVGIVPRSQQGWFAIVYLTVPFMNLAVFALVRWLATGLRRKHMW